MNIASFVPARPTVETLTSFFSRVRVESSGCWVWLGATNYKGYGVFQGTSAHRWTFAWFVAPIRANREIDHLCRVRACVNPAHGEAVTGAENRRRANRFSVTGRCARGHVLADVGFANNNGRMCRACRRITQARYARRRGMLLGPVLQSALMNESRRMASAQRVASR